MNHCQGDHPLSITELTPSPSLNQYEVHLFAQVNRASLTFGEPKPLQIVGYAQNITAIFNSQEVLLPSVIKFVQKLEGFKELSLADQLEMIRVSFPEMIICAQIGHFSFDKDCAVIYMVSMATL